MNPTQATNDHDLVTDEVPIEPDRPWLGWILGVVFVSAVIVIGLSLGLREVYWHALNDTVQEQRLSVQDSRLKVEQKRSNDLLAGGVDPKTGKKGIPIDQAMKQLVSQPSLLAPAPNPLKGAGK